MTEPYVPTRGAKLQQFMQELFSAQPTRIKEKRIRAQLWRLDPIVAFLAMSVNGARMEARILGLREVDETLQVTAFALGQLQQFIHRALQKDGGEG